MIRITIALLIVLASGAGCSLTEWIEENFPTPIDEYWISSAYPGSAYGYGGQIYGFNGHAIPHDVDELIVNFGPPDGTYEARPRNSEFRYGIPALSYVYDPDPESSQVCFDTYVVVIATGEIVRYYCR
jgi:hypothetical protein